MIEAELAKEASSWQKKLTLRRSNIQQLEEIVKVRHLSGFITGIEGTSRGFEYKDGGCYRK